MQTKQAPVLDSSVIFVSSQRFDKPLGLTGNPVELSPSSSDLDGPNPPNRSLSASMTPIHDARDWIRFGGREESMEITHYGLGVCVLSCGLRLNPCR